MKDKKKMSLTTKIFIGLLLGIVFGVLANMFIPKESFVNIDKVLGFVGTLFMNGIKMVIVPLVLFSIICGTASIGDVRKLGRVGVKIITYYMLTTVLAVVIGLILANIFQPGAGIVIPKDLAYNMTQQPPSLNILDMLAGMIPTNPVKALVDGNMLQIIVFALIFGVGMSLVGEKAKPLLNVIEQANEVMLKIVGMVMLVAPYAVFALMAKIIAVMGISAMVPLLKYVVTIVIAIFIQGIVVYGSALYVFARLSIIKFYKKFLSVMAFAFSTCSSNAVIPLNLDACERKLGVPRSISSFTIPLGATVNMDGSAIMQGIAAVFIAQAFGIHLSMQSQITIVIMATLSSIGAAGVPGAAIVMLAMVLQSVGLDTNGIALIIGVDRIVDMFRTTLNITGDAVGTVIVAKSEKELDTELFNSYSIASKQPAA